MLNHDLSNDLELFLNGLNINPIPLEFTQALTTSEFLHALLAYVKNSLEQKDAFNEKLYKEFEEKFKTLADEIDEKIESGSIFENSKTEIEQYILSLIGESLKYITFELDENGYFVAYIPNCLVEELTFDTVYDTSSEHFGKLVVIY